MNTFELKTAMAVAMIFLCRMMGLFMVLPIMSLYGQSLEGATLSLLGLAVGVYGLSQALLQIPLSMLSDVYGRKRIMLFGLSVFLMGSIGAIFADNIWLLIICRALQGSGAIAGTSMALLADISSVQARTRVMALVGISIGTSFVIALIVGPLLATHFGLQGVFVASSILAGLALVICFFLIEERRTNFHRGSIASNRFINVLKDSRLMAFAFSIFILHLVMTSSFVSIPIILEKEHLINRDLHWKIYLGVFSVAILFMGLFARPSSDPAKLKKIYINSTAAMACILFFLAGTYHFYYLLLSFLCAYFTCFNLLEALLPSLMSQQVDEQHRATAMGVFSSFQFLGAFVGGLLSGVLMQFANIFYLLITCGILVCLGLAFTFFKGFSSEAMSQAEIR